MGDTGAGTSRQHTDWERLTALVPSCMRFGFADIVLYAPEVLVSESAQKHDLAGEPGERGRLRLRLRLRGKTRAADYMSANRAVEPAVS